MSEIEIRIRIALTMICVGLILSALTQLFYHRTIRHSQNRWQKYVVPPLMLVVSNLITVFGISLIFFFSPDEPVTFSNWFEQLNYFLSCFGCLLSFFLLGYFSALFYINSDLEEQVRERYHIKNWWRRNR